MNNYVIIGNGVAAVGCIEGIRSINSEDTITVISEEKHAVYGRPLISYYLEGKTDLDRMNYREKDFYDKNKCNVLYGKKVTSIDEDNKNVVLDDGTNVPYTSLCIATGSSPFLPPLGGLETVDHKYSFMTLDDAIALNSAVDSTSRVLIIGAGLIGLKCAEGLKNLVKSITVCDLADRVLSSILDAECAELMQKHLEKNGISFMLGDSVKNFESNKATMNSGKEVEFDVVVIAIGVRANTSLLKDIGGDVDRGILVENDMKTSKDNIYAAGDCTQGYDSLLNEKRVLALLPNAYMQGRTAGVNMAGGEETFGNAIAMNSIGFFGLHAMTAGVYDGELFEEKGEGYIKRLFVKDNQLRGFIIIGKDERAGIYTALIREKTPLDTLNFEILKKSATNLAFSEEIRKNKFGGVV